MHIASEKIVYLDGWRGMAIGLVLLAHFFPTPRWFDAGGLGVAVFFALSGLLMSNILFVKRTDLKTFYKRRISRVFPLFVVFVLVTFAGWWILVRPPSPVEFLATLTFLRTYIPTSSGIWQSELPIGHLWSLNVEEHSYVYLSLLTLIPLLRRREGWALFFTGVASTSLYVAYIRFADDAPHWGDLGSEVASVFVMFSGAMYLLRRRVERWVQPWMPIVAFALAAGCFTTFSPWWSRMLCAPIGLAFAANHLDVTFKSVQKLLSLAPLRLLGLWSYSLYVWQQPFYVYQESFPTGVAFILAFALSLASYYLLENPSREWLNRNW